MTNKYNPMSKEFQDECKKLGLTGNQLAAKKKREGKSLEKGIYKQNRVYTKMYIEEELLSYLAQFYKKFGRPPTEKDFKNNTRYPNFSTYARRFGSWADALKMVGLDVESMVKRGIIKTPDQKARISEIIIRDHFKTNTVDLAGENKLSLCDGICPNGKTYDVKSSKLYTRGFWSFSTDNEYKEEIEIYYLLAFDKDYSELMYAWRITAWEVIEKNALIVGLKPNYRFNIKNMKYDITENIRDVLKKYGFFNSVENIEVKVAYDRELYDGYIAAG